MTAQYPSNLAAFTTHNDVTDIIYASHPNTIQDEVFAVENVLGTSPQLSTTPSPSGTFQATSTAFSTVGARLANIETGIVADTHTQYLRKAADASNVITPTSGGISGLVITAASGQTANLQEWRNASNVVIAYVDANGNLNGVNSSSTTAGLQDILMMIGA
jgi:hypothetical protein